MRLLPIFCILLLSFFNCKGEIYTFHTNGAYSDPDNWDIYPGTELLTNDTISIEANCYDIQLFAADGLIVFSEDVWEIGIFELDVWNDCQIEFQSTWFMMNISGYGFTYESYMPISFSSNTYIEINNSGWGISSSGCIFDYNTDIFYWNFGTQDSHILECMDGEFINEGVIEISWPSFYLNCALDLANGTIEGFQSFDFYQLNGSLNQSCSTCTATINNVNNLYLNSYNEIKGTVILNAPE